MKGKNFNSPYYKLRVLVAPLDWGLGHTTRCIPVILKLIELNCEVLIAAEGPARYLLQQEFPDAEFVNLRGYRVRYSQRPAFLFFRLFMQFPKIINRIYTEHRWLKKTVVRNKIDAVISDNRFGMFHAEIPCIYITHQLSIKTGNRFTDRIAQKIHYRFINKFKECWVPDLKEEINLAGKLSHPVKFPHTPVKYIGPLSRFKKTDEEIKFDIAIILSGPEPQRTVFENIILKDLQNCSGKVLLIRGLPENSAALPVTRPDVQIHNHLPAEELNKAILQSALVISRAGYTTIMDLIKLQKKAILVPTPGQTEQEYLAAYLQQQKLFYYMLQEAFSIEGALKIAGSFSLCENSIPQNTYEAQLESFVNTFNNTGT